MIKINYEACIIGDKNLFYKNIYNEFLGSNNFNIGILNILKKSFSSYSDFLSMIFLLSICISFPLITFFDSSQLSLFLIHGISNIYYQLAIVVAQVMLFISIMIILLSYIVNFVKEYKVVRKCIIDSEKARGMGVDSFISWLSDLSYSEIGKNNSLKLAKKKLKVLDNFNSILLADTIKDIEISGKNKNKLRIVISDDEDIRSIIKFKDVIIRRDELLKVNRLIFDISNFRIIYIRHL